MTFFTKGLASLAFSILPEEVNIMLLPESASMFLISSEGDSVSIGTATPPIEATEKNTSGHSGRFSIRIAIFGFFPRL